MSEGDEVTRALIDSARILGERGLVVAGAGNISVRDGDRILISRAGLRFETAESGDFASVNLASGESSGPRPSSELGLHLGLHQLDLDRAVVHFHGAFSTAVGTVLDALPAIHYSIHRMGPTVPIVDYHLFGSPELAAAVHQAAEGGVSAVLLRNHGAVVWADTIPDAVERALLLEWMCEVYWRAQLLGAPRLLARSDLEAVAEQSARIRYGPRDDPPRTTPF